MLLMVIVVSLFQFTLGRRNMFLLLLWSLLYLSDAAQDEPEVKLKFFKNVSNNLTLLNEIHEAILNYRPITIKHNQDDNVPENYELYDKETKEAMNTKVYSRLKYKYPTMLQKYETHSIKRGVERLRDIPYYMSIELHIRKDSLPPLDIYVQNFTKKARNFFNELYKQNFSKNIDKESSLIDTVYTFNGLVYDEELTILNDMILKYDVNINSGTTMTILKHFYNEAVDNQRADIEYLCLKFEICRPTVRFTDNISDIARELLKLSDAKLGDILLKLLIYAKEQTEFFESILGKSSATEITTELEDLVFGDITKLRQTLVDLRSYLATRHKFSQNPEEDTNIRNKALRILFDIIDQSFNIDGDEILAMHFNIILKSIEDWSEGRNNEIEKILKAFVQQAVGLMKSNLSDDATNEIKALVDVLMRKEDRNNNIYRYIFTHGSMFVKGEDIPLKLSLLF